MHDRRFGATAELSHHAEESPRSGGKIVVLLRPGQMDDSAMAMRQKALSGQFSAALVIGAYGGKNHRLGRTVKQHNRHLAVGNVQLVLARGWPPNS